MSNGLLTAAKLIADQLADLETARLRIADEALVTLEREDPQTASLALQTFEDQRKAADWLTHSVRSLGNLTPWRCISDGKVDKVRNILYAIKHGDFI